jgi:hypothetical protein
MRTRYRCHECGRSYPDRHDHFCGSEKRPLCRERLVGVEDIPEGESGDIRIERKTFDTRTNVAGNWHNPSFMEAGDTIVTLRRKGSIWMSNTPDEIRDQWFSVVSEEDKPPTILIGGLGLGIAIQKIHERHTPEKVVVVEIDPDVISLVAPTYASLPWLEIVEGDIKEYGGVGPKDFFDVAWIDIWGNYSLDDLDDMFSVRRSLRKVMKPGTITYRKMSRVQIWKEEEIKYARRNRRW